MLIPVLIISSLVHIYSIGYMGNDPLSVLGKHYCGEKITKFRGNPKAYGTKLYLKKYKWMN
jgi:hypothetical protein